MPKRVLLTGESGQIGLLIKSELVKKGYLIINDHYSRSAHHRKSSLPFTFNYKYQPEIDITNSNLLDKIISKAKPEIIIHTAAFVGTDKCKENMMGAYDVNVKGTVNLCTAMNKSCPDSLFVNFSSTATMDPSKYGIKKPITESTTRRPLTWYGITKLWGEEVVKKRIANWVNLLPVFLFSTYPRDNSSIWPKTFFGSLNKKPFNILLDPKIYKQYEYADNVTEMIVKVIENVESVRKDVVIAGREVKLFGDAISIASEEFKNLTGKKLIYKLSPEEDYCKNHVADNSLMLKLSKTSHTKFNTNRKDFRIAIKEVIKSCL
jgi:nucleoside-diphosphate-sugar epimerase